jgi:hypothetical protein
MKTQKLFGQRIACYDDGKSGDRYTVVYLDQPEKAANTFAAVGMNHEPFHPQGIGQHCAAMPGRHLGRRIAFLDLPADCQKVVLQDLKPQNAPQLDLSRLEATSTPTTPKKSALASQRTI